MVTGRHFSADSRIGFIRMADAIVKCWFVLCVHATAWFLAAVAGLVAGRFVKRHFVRCLLAFGIGFAFIPIAVNLTFDTGKDF